MSNVTIHTPKSATWQNAAGDQVPYKFVPQSDRYKESMAGKIYKAASAVEASLKSLYALMDEATTEIKRIMKEEYEIKNKKSFKPTKGNVTWYNFDKSIKIEAEMNEVCKWDGAMMTEAQVLLKKYISQNMGDTNILISDLVTSAFSNSKGMIDTAKVFQILRYEDKIKHSDFQKACQLMRQAQSIDRSKLYQRIWEKDEKGGYRNIVLNFSQL